MFNDVYLHTLINNIGYGFLSLMSTRLLPIVNAMVPFGLILFKAFRISMDLVANYAVICGSVFATVGLFLKNKVSVPSTVAPLVV